MNLTNLFLLFFLLIATTTAILVIAALSAWLIAKFILYLSHDKRSDWFITAVNFGFWYSDQSNHPDNLSKFAWPGCSKLLNKISPNGTTCADPYSQIASSREKSIRAQTLAYKGKRRDADARKREHRLRWRPLDGKLHYYINRLEG